MRPHEKISRLALLLFEPADRLQGRRQIAALNFEVTKELANADAKPEWNKGDFFGVKFGRK